MALFAGRDVLGCRFPQPDVVIQRILQMCDQLPERIRGAKLPSPRQNGKGIRGGTREQRFAFQAANITAAVQLVRTVLFVINKENTIEQNCVHAQKMAREFKKLPPFYQRVLSSPSFHHLAGIGVILGSKIESPVPETDYLQIRQTLLDILHAVNSDEGIPLSTDGARIVRCEISRIDALMSGPQFQGVSFSQPGLGSGLTAPHSQSLLDVSYSSSLSGPVAIAPSLPTIAEQLEVMVEEGTEASTVIDPMLQNALETIS